MMLHCRSIPALTLLGLLLLLAVNLAALQWGAASVGFQDLLFPSQSQDSEWSRLEVKTLMVSIRLPRIVLADLTGMGLALAGSVLQAVFRNPLADAGVMGISSGAALGAATALVLGPGVLPAGLWAMGAEGLVPVFAFAGALLTTVVVTLVARSSPWMPASQTLLAGIAVSALSGAGLGILTYLADDQALRSFTFWSLGSLASGTWEVITPVALILLPSGWALLRMASTLNLLLLGDREALHLGVDVRRLKRQVIVLAALVVGALVSVTGVIGFIGLVAPQFVRLSGFSDHRAILPLSALLGAVLMSVADLLARTMAAPAELPIGFLTALLGAPFFIWLLRRQREGAPI